MVKWVAFLGTLHWLAGGLGLGVGGVSYVELLSISVSAVPFGPGIENWRSCRFIGAMMRSLCLLNGGLVDLFLALLVLIIAGFVILVGRGVVMVLPRGLGRVLRSLFWMSYYSSFITLLGLLVHCMLAQFPFRYCAAGRAPTWRLPVSGHVASLVAADLGVEGARREVHRVSGSGPGRKRI